MKSGFTHFDDGDGWLAGESIPNIDLFFCQIWLRSFVNNLANACGRNYSKILAVFEKDEINYYFGSKDCLQEAKHIVEKLCDDQKFGETLNAKHVDLSDELEAHAKKISTMDLTRLSNNELAGLIEEHVEIHTRLYEWGWLPVAIDMFHPVYTEMLKEYLRGKAQDEAEVNAFFITLSAPQRLSAEALQLQSFLDLAIAIENNDRHRELFTSASANTILRRVRPSLKKMLEVHLEKYAPVVALWIGQPITLSQLVVELSEYLKSGKSPSQERETMITELEARKRQKKELLARLKVDKKHARLFDYFAEFMVLKFYRRYAQLRALYAMRRMFQEIGRRLNIPESQAHFLITPEYRKLLDGSFDPAQLEEREKFCVLYSEKGMDKIWVGDEAKRIAARARPKTDLSTKELKGQPACLGHAKGRVKIIISPADIPKMQQGDVLVAIATNPDVVPAMRIASAIVTEQGGVTCHAAIVSRELGIPCVIGTKIATKWLKDGDLVEVDANNGVVKKIIA